MIDLLKVIGPPLSENIELFPNYIVPKFHVHFLLA